MAIHYSKPEKRPNFFFIFLIITVFIGGTFYIYASWYHYSSIRRIEVIRLAVSASAFIEPLHLKELKNDSSDLQNDYYNTLKTNMISFAEKNQEIKFAYLLTLKDNKLFFIVDSETPSSKDYSPPGQEYTEITEYDWLPFSTGEAVLKSNITDRWGTWVSVFVPIKDSDLKSVIAVFGIDYPVDSWTKDALLYMIQPLLIVTFILILILMLYRALSIQKKFNKTFRELKDSELLFRSVFTQAPVGIALLRDYSKHEVSNDELNIIDSNEEFLRIVSRKKDEGPCFDWKSITHPDDLSKDSEMFEQYKSGKFIGYSLEKRYVFPNGSVKWVNMMIRSLDISEGSKENKYHLCIIKDITDRKNAEETLKESERSKRVLLENLPGMAYRCKNDHQWTMEFVSKGCFDLTGYHAENLINNKDLSYNDLIADDYKEIIWDEWKRVLELHEPFRYEYEIVTSSKKHKWVLETGQGIFRKDGSIEALEGIIVDITESKMRQYQIEYANDHDFMTGLFNRRYYETQKDRLEKSGNTPVSILVADINGVRMINDTFGHIQGDILIMETAKLLQKCCRESDILARIGGDEFAIILPYTSREKALEFLKNIRKTFDNFNSLTAETKNRISLSMGYGTKDDFNDSLLTAEKEADEYLRRRKIFEQKSLHNSVLSSIMATMYARSQETEEHSQRISENCIKVAERLGLTQSAQDELHLFAMLHDIGKVGIDDRILNKPGKLTDEEWTIMKTHPEIGFRIVMSVPELSSVANYILTHHERWDGKGYPLGISGEDIPILSRILAVADAYDAMIESRVYRKALSKEEALNEIKKNSGTQFDPTVSSIFIEILNF